MELALPTTIFDGSWSEAPSFLLSFNRLASLSVETTPLFLLWKKIKDKAFHDWENLTASILRSAASRRSSRFGVSGWLVLAGDELWPRGRLGWVVLAEGGSKTVWPPSCVEALEQRDKREDQREGMSDHVTCNKIHDTKCKVNGSLQLLENLSS